MRQAQLVVLERIRDIDADFQTEPFETAWVNQATLFVVKHESAHDNDYLEVSAQISADGINWYDTTDDVLIIRGDTPGGYLHLNQISGALRFHCRVSHGARFKLTLQLHLKE